MNDGSQSSRRDFLRGKALADALGQLSDALRRRCPIRHPIRWPSAQPISTSTSPTAREW